MGYPGITWDNFYEVFFVYISIYNFEAWKLLASNSYWKKNIDSLLEKAV